MWGKILDTESVSTLLETLARELEQPRVVTAQVVKYLGGSYSVDRDAVGPFITNELPKLEDYEHDLILSPLYTPKLADQAIFAGLLGNKDVPREQWPGLIQQLAARPTHGRLVIDSESYGITLREVTLELFVHRLRLEGRIPESLHNAVERAPADDHPMLRAVARRAVWETGARLKILERYLTTASDRKTYRLSDAVDLLNMVESYQPADAAHLLALIPPFQKTLEEEINSGLGSKPFFSATVQNWHGGGRDQRREDNSRLSAKEKELAFLDRLTQIFEV